ncbi:hypothetical protein HYS50_03755 [Candidatus Woesearchaeota archaeon]|nr:hypothetical protein [Candidatus Woesearchaeota archaeon]
MGEKDFVGDVIEYSFSGIIPIDDLYKAIQKWAKTYDYKIIEKEHKTVAGTEKREHVFTWTIDKKVTDYIKYDIDVEVKVKNLKEVKVKERKKKYYEGDIEFSFSAYLNKDYEDAYGKNPLIKFTREVYDKYVTESKMKTFEKELGNERDKLINEIKTFLNLQKLTTEDSKKEE